MLCGCFLTSLLFGCAYSRARERDLLLFNLPEHFLRCIKQLIQGADGDRAKSMDAFPKALCHAHEVLAALSTQAQFAFRPVHKVPVREAIFDGTEIEPNAHDIFSRSFEVPLRLNRLLIHKVTRLFIEKGIVERKLLVWFLR